MLCHMADLQSPLLGASITAVGLYLVEISPKNIRGFLGLLPTTSRYLGGFIEQCFGHYKVSKLKYKCHSNQHPIVWLSAISYYSLWLAIFADWMS